MKADMFPINYWKLFLPVNISIQCALLPEQNDWLLASKSV